MEREACETLLRCKRRISRIEEGNAVVETAIFRGGSSACDVDLDGTAPHLHLVLLILEDLFPALLVYVLRVLMAVQIWDVEGL